MSRKELVETLRACLALEGVYFEAGEAKPWGGDEFGGTYNACTIGSRARGGAVSLGSWTLTTTSSVSKGELILSSETEDVMRPRRLSIVCRPAEGVIRVRPSGVIDSRVLLGVVAYATYLAHLAGDGSIVEISD